MLGWLSTETAATPLKVVLGAKIANKLATAFGMHTVADMLTHLPQRYIAQGSTLNVDFADVGETITTTVRIERIAPPSVAQEALGGRRYPLKLSLTDGNRTLPAAIFGAEWLRKILQPGMRLLIIGTLSEFRQELQLKNVDLLVLGDNGQVGPATGKLATLTKTADGMAEVHRLLARPYLPIYRGKKGVAGLHLAVYMQRLIEWLPTQDEPLPERDDSLISFDHALRGVHFPPVGGPELALRRLKYDEALELQLAVNLRRAENAHLRAPESLPIRGGVCDGLRVGLHFELTAGQQEVSADIRDDLASTRPMNRLLAGEVGSGKTVVAALAMAQVIDAGRQCAFLAPTEVLAQQHFRSLQKMFDHAGVDINVRLLTGSLHTADRREVLLDTVCGEADIVVGTHALLSEGVEFFDLGLVVVDEQHRFGVRQRDELRSRGRGELTPHLLVMTATPIPRTVAMTVFGDLEVSQLTELPGGRKEIQSFVVPTFELPRWEDRAWARIQEEVAGGGRAFIVCSRITAEGDSRTDESVETNAMRAEQRLPSARIGVLHGQLPAAEKDEIMLDFAEGRLDVLVSTTVIEVGVDVPEATVMMIRRAESFSIAQIHQLRGRVGRGTKGGICFLCTHTFEGTPQRARLEKVAATNDGLALAELDLTVRSFGDILGNEQSGMATGLGLVDLTTDGEIIAAATDDAADIVLADESRARALTIDIAQEEADFLDRT